MEVRCYLTDYHGVKLYDSPTNEIVVENIPLDSRRVQITIGDSVAEVVGYELLKAVENCLNVS